MRTSWCRRSPRAMKGECDDPQNNEPNIEKQEAPEIAIDSPMETEHF